MKKNLLITFIGICILWCNTFSQYTQSPAPATVKVAASKSSAHKLTGKVSPAASGKAIFTQQSSHLTQGLVPVNSISKPSVVATYNTGAQSLGSKSVNWCFADKVTNNYIQQQLSVDPDYSKNMNKMTQQVQQWITNNPNYLQQKAVKTIPVVVHIVYNTPDENVSNALIYDMLNILNEDFRRFNSDTSVTRAIFKPVAADAQIEFCLAQRDPANNPTNGITRTTTTKTYFDPDTETDDMKKNSTNGQDGWNAFNYLNIWICDIDNGAGFGTAGYAYLPTPGMHGSWRDGLVLDNNIGLCYGCRTTTHEIGHYLGLKHTWGNNPPSCSNDDGYTDTPTSSDENFGCNYSQNTCSNDVPNLVDQIENYMSYADCQNMFSTMQANAMNASLNTTRSSLLSSQACQPTAPPVTDFAANKTTITAGQYVQFTDLSTGGPTSWSWDFGGGGTPNASSFQNPFIQFSTIGTYTVTLSATNSLGSDAEVKNAYINVIADTSSCDIIHWSYLSVEDSLTLYYADDGAAPDPPPEVDGWLSGTNIFDDKSKAQLFTAPEYAPNTHITGGLFWFYYAYKSGTSNGKVIVTLWDDDGAGASPGTVLGTDTLDLADIVADIQGGFYTQSLFIPPVTVTGNFYYGFQMVGFDLWAGGTKDTLVIVQTQNGAGASGNLPWEQWSDNSWHDYNTAYGGYFTRNSLFIAPFMTDMPTAASFTADTTSGCAPLVVNFDATASQNFDSLYWDIDGNDTADYVTYDSSISIQYNAPGTYSITMWSFGPCGGLDKMKKTNYLTINSVPTATSTSTATACVGCNGSATVSATGGSSPYTYLWNDPSPQTASAATGLCVGSYQVLITDNNGCTVNSGVSVNTTAGMSLSVSSVDAFCGFNNGTATANVSGGVPTFSYLWSNAQTTSAASGLTDGTYNVTVTDGNGCTVTTDFFSAAVVSAVPYVNDAIASGTNLTCYQNNSGAVSVAATTGVTPYTYLWTGGCSSSNCINLAIGTYNVTVTDNNGCSSLSGTTITEPPLLDATPSSTPVLCSGGNTGTATVTPSGGTGSYSYNWSAGGQTTQTATGLSAGNVDVTVSDANSCSVAKTINVGQPQPLTAAITTDSVSCKNGNDGTATAAASGGSGSYTYNWTGGQTNSTATGLIANTYSVTVSDSNACTYITSAVVAEPAMLLVSIIKTNVLCNGDSSGSATANAFGGTGAYTYNWPDGQTASAATGLYADTFAVTVTDANNCSATATAIITEPAVLTALTNAMDASCNGISDGSITVTAGGGITPYSYNWSGGGSSSTDINLTAGTYFVTVTDGNNCTVAASDSVAEPAVLAASASVDNDVSCYGGNDGAATASATGGTGSYTYDWTDGQSTATAISLNADTFGVLITDANGCFDTASVIIAQPPQLTVTTSVTDATCGMADGDVTANASGGSGIYSYSWNPGGQTIQTATGLAAAVYNVTVTDGNSCTVSQSASVSNAGAASLLMTKTNNLCFGESNAMATATPTGGAGSFTYQWDAGTGSQTDSTATGLAAGTYDVTVTDSVNCVSVGTITITDPILLSSVVIATDISCNGLTDGAIDLTVSGGTGAYTYIWVRQSDSTLAGLTQDLNNLTADVYGVLVIDGNGCQDSNYATINEPAAITVTMSKTNVSCYLGSDGTATAAAGGGIGAYTYLWSDGQTNSIAIDLINDVYDITVTDGSGCTATNGIFVTEPAVLTASQTVTNVSCNGLCDGAVSLSVSGGTAPYTYTDGTALCTGSYNILVTDTKGCVYTASGTITEPAVLTATATPAAASCNSVCDGSASVSASGGTTPYSYAWNGGGTGNVDSNLCAGAVNVTVTDANGCTTANSATVTEPSVISATAAGTDATCFGICNASASVTVSGGSWPYTYLWTPGNGTGTSATGLCPNTYTVDITDANGCTSSQSVSVSEPAVLSANVDTTYATPGGGCSNGTATANVSGGTSPYQYTWSTGETTSSITGLPVGGYSIWVSDGNGCLISANFTIDCYVAVLPAFENSSIEIYPNPANGIFRIMSNKLQITHVEVYNLVGKKMFDSQIMIPKSSFVVDLSAQPEGMYYIHLLTDAGFVVEKLTLIK